MDHAFCQGQIALGGANDLTPASASKNSPKKLRLHEKFKKEREEQIAAGTHISSPFEHIDFYQGRSLMF
jgi:hypothetical protein